MSLSRTAPWTPWAIAILLLGKDGLFGKEPTSVSPGVLSWIRQAIADLAFPQEKLFSRQI
jgi:hypothetical protein